MSRTASRRRSGFSLIELLVVIAVISTLIGLLLPAVQKTREAASRVKCQNNLKQIGLACHLYENAYGRFPPSREEGEGPSWAWIILPQLEQGNLHGKWTRGTPIYQLSDPGILLTPVPVYFCPSRRSPNDRVDAGSFDQQIGVCVTAASTPGTVGDYSAGIGTTGADNTVTRLVINVTTTVPPTGMFVQTTGVRAADVTDGLSNTLLVGEKHIPRGKTLVPPFDCNIYDGHNSVCSTRSAGPGFPLAQAPTDERLLFGGPHVGTCMFAFADGGVRPVRVTIDEYALGLLSHRADGQPAPSDY